MKLMVCYHAYGVMLMVCITLMVSYHAYGVLSRLWCLKKLMVCYHAYDVL
jgi:hypothetical protein